MDRNATKSNKKRKNENLTQERQKTQEAQGTQCVAEKAQAPSGTDFLPAGENAVENNVAPSLGQAVVTDGADAVVSPDVALCENVHSESDEEIAAKIQKKMRRHKRRKMAKRMRILNWAEKKDIRYRGFLSYRGLRILAWLFFLVSQVGVLLSLGAKMDKGFAATVGNWAIVLPLLRNFVTPLFLIAAFATILNNSRKFCSLLCTYGFLAIVFYALFCLLHDRYMVGIMMALGKMSRADAKIAVDNIITLLTKNGYFCFNIFIDLFLCTLFTFFIVYRPQKVFVGKKVIVFRLFAILPVLYEIGSIAVKIMVSFGVFKLPTHIYPLLTTKPPMTFFIFLALTFFIKKREWLYRRNSKTHEEYQAFLSTNLNSLQFSTFLTIQVTVVGFFDLILTLVLGVVFVSRFAGTEEPYYQSIMMLTSWGIGESFSLIPITPFIMLFSYTRAHKNTKIDLIINLLGIIALILIYLEGLYQAAVQGIGVIERMIERMLSV